ncbi:hypothetical protein LOZ53_005979 [Ophidiomyces ophidiicola]|nr:hypothetical protein LOZ55_006449 [Ophidiomyces ophidiicola]KAI1982891.1 hypothetical protein LOZ54_005189 [Ophidiomyces ophidiicola]KAI1983202.1 hypothetical protein LOZ53_005979 [Ophidiomyces ophidiicola]KAI1988023.1 hypothetical protein LOZ51_005502 [Ophidiomyces ophidiicola]
MHFLKSSFLFLLPLVAASPLPQEDSDIVPGKYIVTLKDGVTQADIESHKSWVSSIHSSNLAAAAAAGHTGLESDGIRKVFQIHDFKAYSGSFDAKTAEDIRRNPLVKSVSPDRKVYLASPVQQNDAGWNLGHMSSKGRQSWTYKYDSSAGEGVWAYVLDSGINVNHIDFEGRAILGYNALKTIPHADNLGHGTYVAGVIASKTYGVAKKATVVSAKAFDTGSTTYDFIFDAFNWIVKNITDSSRQKKAVINMSITSAKYQEFDDAVEAAIKSGITVVVAAGNNGKDAMNNTPASAPNAITVGAFRFDNTRSYFSNYGKVVDLFAPGERILSTWKGANNNGTNKADGTSVAAPHVAGLVAYLMAREDFATPADVTKKVLGLAIPNLVKNPGTGSPNLLAYNGINEEK